jgi:hypothetical protein
MTDRFTPIYQVKLEQHRVAGADLMVVYETAWNRWSHSPRPCPSSPGPGGSGVKLSYLAVRLSLCPPRPPDTS